MQIDYPRLTFDTSENPFKDFGPLIVDNLVEYSSYEDEEEEHRKREEDKNKKEA